MSYEEARRNRRRQRKANNVSMILGALAGLGNTLSAQKSASDQRKWLEQRDALKAERDLAAERRKNEHDDANARLSRQTQLDVAGIYAGRQSGLQGASAGVRRGRSIVDMSGGDVAKARAAINEEIAKGRAKDDFFYDASEPNKRLRDLDEYAGWMSLRDDESRDVKAPMGGEGLGDIVPNYRDKWHAMSAAGQGAKAPPQASGDMSPGSPNEKSSQNVVGQNLYKKNMAEALRMMMAGDARGFAMLQELYGGTLDAPPWMTPLVTPPALGAHQ